MENVLTCSGFDLGAPVYEPVLGLDFQWSSLNVKEQHENSFLAQWANATTDLDFFITKIHILMFFNFIYHNPLVAMY